MAQPLDSYDLVVAGSGIASSFFLLRYLERFPAARALVIERGGRETHAWRLAHRRQYTEGPVVSRLNHQATFINHTPAKPWNYTPGFGGSSNCWFGCTPRMLESDFAMHSRYGVGFDWPLAYDDLEPYYALAEQVMAISGPDETPYRMSRPYPLPPHRFNSVDQHLKARFERLHIAQPTARPSVNLKTRPACCASSVCNLCPIDAKFTVENSLKWLYEKPSVTTLFDCEVLSLDVAGDAVERLRYRRPDGREVAVAAGLFALGANALFNPFVLMQSDDRSKWLGQGLGEQVSVSVEVKYDATVENFGGSTVITSINFAFYDGPHRRHTAAALVEHWNAPVVRPERGKHRAFSQFKFIFEDIPSASNRVAVSAAGDRAAVSYHGYSPYARRGIEQVPRYLETLLAGLPVEEVDIKGVNATEAHVLGTARMAATAADGVVDRDQRHFAWRNVFVLGGSSFPSFPPANPSLTIAALSMRSADAA